MGILNVTPDSFSDGGQFFEPMTAIERGKAMFAAGADIVDVGGESTRPGAAAVADEEQIRRVVPVVTELASFGTVSIDTRSDVVARAACAAGATIINDVTARLDGVAADMGAGWVAMHMLGDPETMQMAPEYHDVVSQVADYLVTAAERATNRGVRQLWIDPGFGFGKTAAHNVELLAATRRLADLGYPLLVGISRKRTLGQFAAASAAGARADEWLNYDDTPAPIEDRIDLSIAAALWAGAHGADMVRVHDVEATIQAFDEFFLPRSGSADSNAPEGSSPDRRVPAS